MLESSILRFAIGDSLMGTNEACTPRRLVMLQRIRVTMPNSIKSASEAFWERSVVKVRSVKLRLDSTCIVSLIERRGFVEVFPVRVAFFEMLTLLETVESKFTKRTKSDGRESK